MRREWQSGWLGRARDERHVQPAGAKLHHRFTGRAFGDLDFNIGVILAVLADQLCEEAMRNQGMDTDTKPAASPAAAMPAVFTAWSGWSMPTAIRSTKWRPASVSRTPRA